MSPGNRIGCRGSPLLEHDLEVEQVAGHRRGTGRPPRAQSRAQRRRALLVARLAQARTPADRLGAAYGYARAELLDLPPAEAAARADELVRLLIGRSR